MPEWFHPPRWDNRADTAQLTDAANWRAPGRHRYDRDRTDIFEVQDEVVEKIVGALAVTLTRGEQQAAPTR